MQDLLLQLKNNANARILDAESAEELNKIKLELLGKSGELTVALKGLAKLSDDERPQVGKLANEIKTTIEIMIDEKMKQFLKNEKVKIQKTHLDITMPGKRPPLGSTHLVSQAIEEITAIFEKIGFTRVRYPEVEWDYYAFGALNFPDNHPARDEWETFFVKEKAHPTFGSMLLTPHTSSGQVREMQKGKTQPDGTRAPIKMLNIAKTYRRQEDVSHTQMFHQFETLVVGEGIAITHLKGVLDYFVKSYFGEERRARIRPYQFQFTEPSFETDVSCGVCDGAGCKLCKDGWLELGGAGMVHPNVLKAGGIDPEKYTGFASGWGVERVLMMKEGLEIDDLRLLYSTNLDFLEQF